MSFLFNIKTANFGVLLFQCMTEPFQPTELSLVGGSLHFSASRQNLSLLSSKLYMMNGRTQVAWSWHYICTHLVCTVRLTLWTLGQGTTMIQWGFYRDVLSWHTATHLQLFVVVGIKDNGEELRTLSAVLMSWNFRLSVCNQDTCQKLSKRLSSPIGAQVWAERRNYIYRNMWLLIY